MFFYDIMYEFDDKISVGFESVNGNFTSLNRFGKMRF